MKLRLAVLTNELPPYRRPIFEMLAADGDIEIVALLNTTAEAGRQWSGPGELQGVDVRLTRSVSRRLHQTHEGAVRRERTLQVPLELRKDLAEARPDVILSGEFGPRSMAASLYARKKRIPLILWSEETEFAARSIGLAQRALRKWLFRRADAFVGFGRPACEYLRHAGIPQFKVFECAQAIDNGWWAKAAEAGRSLPPAIDANGRLVLSVGQLVPRKGFDLLLRAWASLPEPLRAGNTLAIVGSGESESGLKDLASALGAGDTRFLGGRASQDLAALYAQAHVFVLPTWLDVWGLVVNEAMACGTPVLCSRGAGAAELVDSEKTGDVFAPGDSPALTALLEKWLIREYERPVQACLAAAAEHSFEKTVEGIRKAIAHVTRT